MHPSFKIINILCFDNLIIQKFYVGIICPKVDHGKGSSLDRLNARKKLEVKILILAKVMDK